MALSGKAIGAAIATAHPQSFLRVLLYILFQGVVVKMRYDDGVVSICRHVWSLIHPRVGHGGDAFQNK